MICNYTNIVWIERGIILCIIEFIVNNLKKISSKHIIIEDNRYRRILRHIFPTIKFSKFKGHKKNNFYFNIRKIIKNQDIVFDYINNYSDYIYGKDIQLIPYYDKNDMMIMYHVSKDRNGAQHYKSLFYNFSACTRGNYYNDVWDYYREKSILVNFQHRLRVNWQQVLNLINNIKYMTDKKEKVNEKKNTKDSGLNDKDLEEIKNKIIEINKKLIV